MGLTGVIYAAIVVPWAIFLVPLALRRHDQTARNRSIERFSSTMRVLSTKDRGASNRVVLAPPRSAERLVPPDARPGSGGASTVARPASRAALRAAAARRRRVLIVLVAVTLLTVVASLLGAVPLWACVAPLAAIAGFLVLARRQVRVSNESYWRRAADVRPASSNVVRRSAARIDASHGAARGDSARAGSQRRDPADDEPTITLSDEQLAAAVDMAEQRVVAVSLATADGASLWDPLPITLPTYVDKPVAKRTVRKITLGESSGRPPGHPAAAFGAGVATGATATAAADTHRTGSSAAHALPAAASASDLNAASDLDMADDGPRAANA